MAYFSSDELWEREPLMSTTDTAPVPANGARSFLSSPTAKLFVIGFIVFILLIPLMMVWALLSDREKRAGEVEGDVSQSWGGAQRVAGPFLIIPFREVRRVKQEDEYVETVVRQNMVFLPEDLSISAHVEGEKRKRSIFEISVYRAKLNISGTFVAPKAEELAAQASTILWDEAVVALGVSDVRAFQDNVELYLRPRNERIPFEPSVGVPGAYINGIHAPVARVENGLRFEIDVNLKGSQTLSFVPAGRDTHVKASSNWPDPSFYGSFLPDAPTISDDGFEAEWRIPHLARSVPQQWIIGQYNLNVLDNAQFGVRFFQSIDFYHLVERSLKYAVLFIVIVFAAVFVLEALSGQRVHMVQYLFVGLSQIVFYLLLLSVAEHQGFEVAYFVAAIATVGLITAYTGLILGNFYRGLIMLVILLLTYGLLYFLLKLEDYALLVGSLAVFAVLAVTMFATLRLDWYSGTQLTKAQEAS